MMDWIKKHPQRIAGLLLVVFTQVQGAMSLAQVPMSPVVSWAVTTVIGIVVAVLAWVVKNTKDEEQL